MTTTVHLVRHVPHEHQGRIQVGRMGGVAVAEGSPARFQALGRRFKRESLAAVYASPIDRTQQTAHAIADPAGVSVQTREDLNEIDVGEWTGRTFEDLADDLTYQHWNSSRGLARCPGGESMLEVQVRMLRWLEMVRSDHPDQTVAAVSHGDPIKSILLYLLGLPLDAYGRIEVEPASISTVVVGGVLDPWGAKLIRLNEPSSEIAAE
ncbi:MAG: histidine phosphatase family protein [Proteobacteria bacterium]|nr:histidine phosphatase family protein [Pseudomonadota bacterium]